MSMIIHKDILNNKLFKMLKYPTIVLLYFLMQYKYLNDAWFITDEEDIMLGGKCIANGFQLYRDHLSQHMPFSYYISALFECFGAITITLQRVYFYIFFSIIWTVIYARYRKYFTGKALLLYPLLFCSLIETYTYGTVILSEHLVGVGIVILFLEYMVFCKTRKIGLDSCVMISLSIVLTFGTTFVSIFSIFFIVLGVIAKEIEWQHVEKQTIKALLSTLFTKYCRLLLIVLIPWAVLCGNYILTNNLRRFIYSAYEMNRSIYPKYLGYGDDIFTTFLSLPTKVCNLLLSLFNFSSFQDTTIIYLIIFILVVCFFVQFYKKNGKISSITLCIAWLALSTRGCYHFHGTQWVEVTSLFAVLAFTDCIWIDKKHFLKQSLRYQITTVFFLALILARYVGGFYDIVNCDLTEEPSVPAQIVSSITNEGEAVWWLSFDTITPMQANRPAIYNCGSAPWFWEAFSAETTGMVLDNPPRVLIYEPEHECWGHKLSDYASVLVNYIDTNYTCYYHAETGIYIRNDYYDEAIDVLNALQ